MVTNNFSQSSLDLNGKITLSQPTALVWGADGRLYITEQSGDVKVLTVAFGDPNTADSDSTASFYVVEAETVFLVKELPNHNDDGAEGGSNNRQVTGIDVTPQYDENGDPVIINGKPAVNIYVTSSDNRIGAGSSGSDTGLDTNSGIITRLTQTVDGWEALDLVRGLARSEENHSLNGLEVIQEFDDNGRLLSERLIVANGGNANAGAPSNNFSGQQETAYSAAILEVDLDQLKSMEIKNDDGRNYVYDIPTLNDPSRSPSEEALTDPFGGNDGFNGGKIDPNGPVQIYSAGYRNAYDVEVTEDGRVWTYDNGANNSWGGRPVGEAGDNGGNIDAEQDENYIATNLNNGDGSGSDSINTEAWNPKNLDQFHEITRSDDLAGRVLSAGQAGAATYVMAHPDFDDPLTLVYGGHPNPTRASGGEAGLLFTPKNGVEDAFLLVSEEHYDSVIDWLVTVEDESNGVSSGDLTSRVISLVPGELYYITENGEAYLTSDYTQTPPSIGGSDVLGTAGVPADIDDVVATLNAIEGNYLEGGYNDGAIDSGTGSINGLTEYTSTVFDDGETKMSGALMAVQLGGGNLIVMGRDENGVMQTASGSGGVKAAERITLTLSGSPLGLASIGDDLSAWDNQAAFRGSVWATVYSGSGTKIEILQPNNGAVPLAGSEAADPTDHDLDGINHIHDPFEYSAANGLALTPGEAIVMNFQPTEAPYPGTIGDTGLMGAALDGTTPNQDANPDQGLPGLYDIGGNIIPGANAALFQIKEVVPGTVVGPVNSVRDAMHVGVNPSSDVQRLVATTQVLNWIADNGSVEDGQLTGLMFGDGTQANFVRLVFGEVNGEAGFEVGYEINDNNYQALAQVAVPGLTDTAVTQVELYLEIDMADGFALYAGYRLNSEDAFTELPLNGFTLPEGVLRDVLTGSHTISDGDSQAPSGAAFGFLAETSEGAPLAPVNFENLKINGFGNEIEADSAGGVGAEGSNGIDTIIYTGTDTVLSPLDDSVENFDGSGTMADFHATGNGGDNVMIAGSGNNTFTGGGGADSFQGTLDTINGTEITDFTPDDEVVVQGASFDASDVTYQAGSAIITINNETAITFSGEGFEDFDPSTGESVFSFTSTANGTRITTVPALTAVAAISSGGPDINNVTVRDQTIDFLSDMTNAEVNGWVSGVTSKDYVNVVDIDGSVPDELHQSERSAEDAGEWGYSIPVENGEYLIDMYFAEIYHGVENSSGTGARVFDISIEDALVEDDYDIIGDVGSAATEVIKTYAVTVTDGVLNIGFDASVNQAKISGLVVWQVGGTYVPPEDVTPPEVVSIMIDQPFDNDSDILATVVVTDNAGINVDSINGDELIFTGYEPGAVSLADNDAITLSNDGKTATIQYTISPPTGSNAWENGAFKVGVAAGSFTDTTGLGIAAFETDVIIARNLEQLVKGALQRAINVGPTSNTIDNSLEGDDKNTYGGAITNDPILGIDLEADDPAYYSPSTKTGSNIDGKAGATGSNSGGVDLDGSAYHTYRDSAAGSYTATYEVPNGLYVVELHFAELYQTQGGQRQGDYTIQGELFAENFDAFIAAGGADKPTVLTKNVIVTDGKIVIDVNADNGEPGFNAIAIYQAVDSGIPIASILSIEAPESSDGQVIVTVQYTDDGNISGTQIGATDVTVSSAAGALVTPSLVAYDSASGIATYTFDAPESGWQTGTITASVAANAVLDSDNNGNSATASSVYVNYSSDGVILELDFENPGSPLEEGGFDGTLGDVVDDTVFTTVEGGELIVWTSNGDISQAADPSANDFIKYVALGDPALETINITSRFDNPFPAALAAQELPTDTVPNFAQQGIVFGLGSQGNNELVKLVFGGNGGNGVQIWSKSAIDTVIPLANMLSNASTTLNDIASVELTLVVNKTAGTVTPIVTFFDTNENVLGGLRAEATDGFATASPEVLPPAVLSNLTDLNSTTAVGVTSTDYNNPIESFMASWDYLNVTSPDLISEPTDPTTTLAIVNAPDIIENGDDGFTTLNFGLTASDGFSGEVELTLSIDGATVTDTLNFSDGTAILSVDVPNDDVANGTNEISVTLVAVNSTGLFEIDASAATATGSVTEDDEGSVPNPDDLDEDGVNNDDDLFPYDAANGMILAAGETFLLDFEEDTASPYEAGLTGLMGRANESNSAGAVESGTASVENGTLNIVADTGDHYTNNNSQKDAYAVGVKNPGGFIVETSFAMPDFDDQQEGLQAPLNYQAGGVAVSLSEDNLVKWIFGANGTAAFQLAHENKQVEGATPAVPGATFALPSGVVYSDIASVKLMLEIVVDTTSGEVKALTRSVLTLNNTNIIDGASGEITLTDPLASAIKDEAQGVSVGFIQTSTGGQSPDTFDISYDYLQVSSTEEAEPQVLVGITDAVPMVENGDEGTTTLSFGLTASEGFSGEVALDLTINGTSEPRTVVFTGGIGSLTVDVANDDQANGPEQVSVILAGIADEAFAIDPAAATATGTVTEDDVGQTVIGITDADSMVENGDEGTTTLSFGLTASEGFSGEVALSVDIDGVVEPRTVVFTGGVGSLTVDVANDDQANGPEQISVILNGIADEAFAIDPAAATATGTVTEDDEVAPTTPVRLQAEDFTTATNYTVENIGAADEGQGIRLLGGESGTASYALAGAVAAGTYTVIVGYFDENDGESTAQLSIGNAQGQSFSGDWIFDNDATSGNAAQASSFRTVTFENVTVGDDATLDLASTAAPFEYARIDYIEFVPAGIVEPPAPTLIGISDADPMVESGDEGATTLSFGLTASEGFSGEVALDLTINGTSEPRTVVFTGGVGSLTVDVANDDQANGPEQVSVILAGIADEAFAIDPAAATATGTVTEDDVGQTVIGITDADSMVENGDEGSTTLSFGLTASEGFSGEVALSVDIDGVVEPRTVVFTGGVGSLTVDVANDDQANGPEQVSVILNGIADEAFAIDPAAATATGTVTEDDEVAPTTPIRLQAEDFTAATNYTVENIGAADEGQGIRLLGGESGTASYALAGAVAAGTYTVIVGYFDENDGESTAQLSIGNAQGQSFSGDWIFDNDATSGNAAQAASFRTVTFENVTVGDDATLDLASTAAPFEYARIDYIEFVPAGIVEPPAPTLIGISNADPMVENGDEGATTLSFGLTASEGFSGEVALSVDIDGVVEPRTVVFTGGVGSLTVDVANDDQANGPEQVSVILNGIADEAFAIDPAAATATGTVTEDDEVAPTTPIRLQAEDFTAATNYTVENIGAADEGQGIRLLGGESGTASYALAGAVAAGTYTVIVGYFDENDGESTAQLSIGNAQGQSFSGDWIFDNDATSGNAAQAASFRTVTFENVTVGDDATLDLASTAAPFEYARIDYIEFVPAGIVEPPAPTLIGISNADPMVENGDEGTTTLSFGLTASEGFSGEVALDLTINGTSEPRTVVFTGGIGSLTVDVANDDQANGPEQVSVILAGIADEAFAIDPAATTATGTVTEDDVGQTVIGITDADPMVENGDEGTTTLSFGLTASEGFSGEVALSVDIDGVVESRTVVFTGGVGSLTVDVANDDQANGPEQVSVILAGIADEAFAIDPAAATATGTVTEDDVGQTVIGITDADPMVENGDEGTTTLSFGLTASEGFSGEVALSVDIDGVVESRTVVFTGGVGSLTVDVANDDQANGPEQVSVILNGIADEAFAIDPAAATATGTVAEDDDVAPTTPVRLQAEDFTTATNYTVENIGAADEGQGIRLQGGESGTASYALAGAVAAGTYTVIVGYFDENDGESTAQLSIGNAQGQSFSGDWIFDNDATSGNAAQASSFRTVTFENVTVGDDATLALSATAATLEYARIDYIEFVPAGIVEPPAPTLIGISDADPMVESGDEGATTLSFGLTASEGFSGEVALDLTINGTSEPRAVVFTGGVGSLTVDVANDDQANGPEQVSVILNGIADEAFAIDPAAATATGTVTEDDEVAPTTPVRLQAEDFTTATNYTVENIGAADEGQGIRLQGGESGTASYALAGAVAAGTYTVIVGYFDENDGESTAQLSIGNAQGQSFSGDWIFDNDATSGNAAQASSFRTVTFENVTVGDDATLALSATAATLEYARIDYIEFVPAGIVEPPAPTLIGISDADPMVESGDEGATTLSFGLTASEGFSGEVALDLTINGTSEPRTVVFTGGVGSLTVDVANDDQANGPEQVSVILAGIADEAFAIDPAAATAMGTVTEDDITSTDPATINLEFDEGETLQGLFDGVTEGSGTDTEETGTAEIINGNLVISASEGDAGGSNNANDNYYTNVSGGDGFTAELKFGNPFPSLPAQYSQLGLNISLSQDEYLKVTFGNVGGGQIEYSYELGGSQSKQTFSLPPSISFAQIADVVVAIEASVDGGMASFSGTMTFLDASGQSLGDTALPALLLPDGPLNTAITSAGEEFGVGVTQTSFGSGPVFVANYDYLRIQQQGEESTDDNDKPVATIAILQPVNTDAELTVVVTYADASGIATETLDNSDIALMLDGVPVAATISFDGFNATTGEATYAISSPAGGWNENGSYTVWVAQGAVSDASENANLVDSTPSTSFMIDFDEGSPLGGYAPGDDLDEDGTANQADEDIDGDGDANVDDVFAYDAQNGQPLADGESIRLNFEVNGTPYQNGFTGVMASSDVAFQDEDTGAGIVADNQLRVTTTSGDTGSANTPQNDYHLGIIRDGGFILESVVDNPFASAPGSYSQLGLAVSVNSNDFAKLVFGSVGQDIEFSSRDNNAETKLGADFPDGYGFGDFAKAKLVLDVSVNNVGNTMATATVTLLDASGEPLPGNASVTISGLELTGALKEAILDPAASVGVGITHTHGAAEAFTAAYDYFEVSAKEDTSTPLPVPATEIEEIFAGANLELSDSYDQGDVGSALVTVTPGGNDVQSSNYGSNSFQVQNTGDKKIAAVFFDVTTALYGDSVFDPDGKGGDATAKEWAINSAGNTGAIQPVGSSGYEHYFLPGIDPEPENSDNNGGYRGALVKFSATANGGFTNGETVGFSGDMDPNSIAGFTKSSVDTGSIPFWDVGGISGAELIGSNVYIKFTDGSTASGQLMSDGSQAGAQVLVSETPPNLVAELSVNGLSAGSQGTYGGEVPSVIVSGPAGEWVRVVMTKGHQPVTNNQDGIADTVNARLADKNFPANNAAEFQFVDVQLGASGTADVSQEFTYGDFLNDTSSFDGDDTLPLGFVASVIDNPNTSDGLGLGPVSQPIYLISNGTPVVDGDTTIPSEGYYLMEDSRLKVQFEDINGPGGVNPPGKWQFFDEADENGNQANFQGVGYYLWGDEDSEALNGPQAELTYTFVIPESAAGEFTLRVRGTRDPGGASDAQNDVWVKIDDNAEELLVSNVNAIDNSGFIKLYGNATGDFGFANFIDSTSDSVPNFPAEFVLDAGVHTITFAGRSEGFHIDFFELYQGNAPSINATNSTFILSGDTEPFVNNPLEDQTIEAEDEFFFEIPDDTFRDLDGDILTYEALNIPDGVFFDAQTKTFSGSPSAGVGNYALEVQVTDEDGATATAGFDLVVVPEDQNEPDTYFVAMVESANGDIEQGSSLSSPDLEIGSYVVGIQFTVPDNINLDDSETIDSAIISWVSDRTHSANSTMTFSVENSLNGAGFGSVTNRNYLSEEEVWQSTGTWQDGENITVGINLANQLNSLIAQEGLNSGDLITVKIEGTGGTRFVEAAGGDRTAPTLAITVADNASASQLSNNATLLFESNSISDMPGDDEFGTLNPSSMSQEVGLVGINDESTVGSF